VSWASGLVAGAGKSGKSKTRFTGNSRMDDESYEI
jgi:hypothetical protein